jgi:photosystem II stability/assembly factor-like uncharacterized protein
MKRLLYTIAAIAFCNVGVLHAQFLWHVTHPDYDGNYLYIFNEISCYGNTCSTCGQLLDTANKRVKSMVWRSIDAGRTWNIQDPGLGWRYGNEATFNNLRVPLRFIQQIDSLNVAAISDSGLFVRSSDGGNSWQGVYMTQGYPYGGSFSFHFHDPLSGILNLHLNTDSARKDKRIIVLTTIDGGAHWDTVKENIERVQKTGFTGYSYGKGKYRIYRQPFDRIFTTHDNWATVDSTPIILPFDSDTGKKYFIFSINFSGGDTLIASGAHLAKDNPFGMEAFIMRSTDAGMTWSDPMIFPEFNIAVSTTRMDRDTLFAQVSGYGESAVNKVLMSTNRGKSWNVDTLKLDEKYWGRSYNGLSMAADGSPIVSFSQAGNALNSTSILIRGERKATSVRPDAKNTTNTYIYPNPATSELNISSQPSRSIRIIDILGREVMQRKASSDGTLTFDVSSLARGVYIVTSETFGRQYTVGRVSIVGN